MFDKSGIFSKDAFHPADFGLETWKRILLRSKDRLADDRITFIGAAVALFCLLGLIPLLSALVGIFGVFTSQDQAMTIVDNFEGMVPPEALSLIREQMRELTTSNTSIGISSFVSILVALWGGSKAMDAFMTAINMAYHEDEDRNFIKRKAVGLILTLGTVLVVAGGTTLLIWANLLEGAARGTFLILKWPLIILGLMLWLSVMYRYAPNRRDAKWRWISHGSIVSTLLWVAASYLFSLYVSNFGNYNETHGSLGAVIVLILWIYLSAVSLIIGAVVNAEMELETGVDTTKGECLPKGERGAYVADNKAAAKS
ncbi:MAG: YihY/virulence factor BrkB family protein [Verrucomicrobiales bacterium]|nr:YihY/virulence factor BrkB family protein [Verrucomicrobiales bacterium]